MHDGSGVDPADREALSGELAKASQAWFGAVFERRRDDESSYPILARVVKNVLGQPEWDRGANYAARTVVLFAICKLTNSMTGRPPERATGEGGSQWLDKPDRDMAKILFGFRDKDIPNLARDRMKSSFKNKDIYDLYYYEKAFQIADFEDKSSSSKTRMLTVIRQDIALYLLQMEKSPPPELIYLRINEDRLVDLSPMGGRSGSADSIGSVNEASPNKAPQDEQNDNQPARKYESQNTDRLRLGRLSNKGTTDALEIFAAAVHRGWADEYAQRVPVSPPLPIAWSYADDELNGSWRDAECTPSQPLIPLDINNNSHEILREFAKVPARRMVILGDRGAGKTVLAMRLLLKIMSQRKGGDPVPVIVSARSFVNSYNRFWSGGKNQLQNWLESELKVIYGPSVSAAFEGKTMRRFVRKRLILPIIDGLDELSGSARSRLVEILNERDKYGALHPVVVTCLTNRYADIVREVGNPLICSAAIQIEPLPSDAVADYLPRTTSGDEQEHSTRWDGLLAKRANSEQAKTRFEQLFKTPLFVSFAQKTYDTNAWPDPIELLDFDRFKSEVEVYNYLLRSFLQSAYEGSKYEEDYMQWLTFIAAHLDKDRNLKWWKLSDAVPRYQRALVFGIGGGLVGLAFGLAMATVLDKGHAMILWSAALGLLAGATFPQWSGERPMTLMSLSELRQNWRHKITCPYGAVLAALLVWIAGGSWWFLPIAAAFGGALVSWLQHFRNARRGVDGRTGWVEMIYSVPAWFGGGVGIAAFAIVTDAPLISSIWWALPIAAVWGLCMDIAFMPAQSLGDDDSFGISDTLGRNAYLAPIFSAMTAVAYSIVIGAIAISIAGPVGVWVGVTCGLYAGIVFGFGYEGRGRWLVFCGLWLPLRQKLPWDTVDFIDFSHRKEVLRQAGAIYQFRHDVLWEALISDDLSTL